MRRTLLLVACVLFLAAAAFLGLPAQSSAPVTAVAPPDRAEPGLVWRNGTMALTLTAEPCHIEDATLYLEQEGIPPARRYVVTQGSRSYSACWAADISGDIMTMDAVAQEPGTIPLDWFDPPGRG